MGFRLLGEERGRAQLDPTGSYRESRHEQTEYYRALARGTHSGSHLILATFVHFQRESW